uniref:gamma-glutamyl hydrolase-like n=1 Tax=Myxine glutinosa TaxID=7769 RepID=UPI00358ECE65
MLHGVLTRIFRHRLLLLFGVCLSLFISLTLSLGFSPLLYRACCSPKESPVRMAAPERPPALNDRPVVGVLAQEAWPPRTQHGSNYIVASYVKFLESAGARVVPIRVNRSEAEYERLFYSINSLLLPGGCVDLQDSEYARAAKFLYHLAIKANDRGDYFPVWGTCLGFEELLVLVAGHNMLIKSSGTTKVTARPINLTSGATRSRMYQDFPLWLLQAMTTEPLAAFNHICCLPLEIFQKDEKLKKFYRLLSTNKDDNGLEFVSSVEAIEYPFYGVQWHPEKNPYEWKPNYRYPHSHNAVRATFHFAEFIVSEARRNQHSFENADEEIKALIYQHPVKNAAAFSCFQQVYFFD